MGFFTFLTPQHRAAASDDGACGEAEQALASKSELLSKVLENVAQGVAMFDGSRRLLVWNDRYQQIVQFPDGFLQVGLSIWEMALYVAERGDYGEGDPEKLTTERLNLLWSGDDARSEITVRDEHIYDVLFRRTDDGGLVITFTDITERKQAEEALRRAHDELETRVLERTNELRREITERKQAEKALRLSEKRFKDIANSSADYFWERDENGRFAYISDRYQQVTGVDPKQILGKTREEVNKERNLPPEYEKEFLKFSPYHRERKSYRDIPIKVLLPDGRVRYWRVTGWPVFDEEGEFRGYRGVISDITDEVRALEALRESEARLSKAAEMAKIGYWVWDEIEDKAVFCSEQKAKMYDIASGEELAALLSSHAADLEWVHPEDRERYDQATREARALKCGLDIEYRIIDSKGKTRHLHDIEEPVLDEHGELIRSNGITQDITEQKRAEEQLRQAQKMEAVGQLTGGVAHDFNNLLAVILGNLEFAKDELEADSSLHLLLDPAIRATERGGELTQRLLSFSRRQALRPQTVDLNACVTGMTGMLRRTLGETIEIEPIIASGLWTCEVDPGQLESALLNLAVNARDAMPKGGRLTIETANIELDDDYAAAQGDVTPGHYVRLSVTDTGTGIPSEIIEHVFEPFFTTKEVGEGSGLGLSTVFGFAKQSGGHVTISSESGCGTTVQLYLPQAEAPAQPAAQEPAMGDPEAQGETVLVVEDDPDVRSLVISLLQRLGYNILEAGDSAEALAALRATSRIDLLLSDVVLPGGVSGPDLVEQVRHRYPGIKVLFMSGYPDAPHRRGPLVENTELLGKPFGKRDLAQKVRAVLNG